MEYEYIGVHANAFTPPCKDNLIRNKPIRKSRYVIKPKTFSPSIRNDLSKAEYYKEVWIITESQHLESLPGIELRGQNFHLDHIMPIAYGFKNNIPPEYIGRLSNLRIISKRENFRKAARYTPNSSKWDYLKVQFALT